MLSAFSDEYLLFVFLSIYALVFFCPGDLFYRLVNFKPFYLVICALKEIYRAKKIFAGMSDGAKFASSGSPFFVPVLIGVLKGNGSAFAAPLVRLSRGDWRPAETEVVKPSATTKACLLAAVTFAYLGAPAEVPTVSLVAFSMFKCNVFCSGHHLLVSDRPLLNDEVGFCGGHAHRSLHARGGPGIQPHIRYIRQFSSWKGAKGEDQLN